MRLLKPGLATPKQRLLARFADIVIELAPLVALGLVLRQYADVGADFSISPAVVRRAALILSLFAVALIIQIVQWLLIVSRGQSVGKILLHIRIVDETHDKQAGVLQVLVLRTWLNTLLIGNILYFLVDSLLIFRKERRCLHDYLARTEVIRE